MKHWLSWSARHKWVSRSLARDEWIARTSDEQIVSNVTACKLALTTRAHDFLKANDGPIDLVQAGLPDPDLSFSTSIPDRAAFAGSCTISTSDVS